MDFAEKLADTLEKDNATDFQEEVVYTWEQGIVKNWERLVETEGGLVVVDEEGKCDATGTSYASIEDMLKQSSTQNVRRGLLRNIVIIFDMSSNMLELDYKPDRVQCMVRCNEIFLRQLLDENPLTQISVVSVYDSIGEVIISYNSNFDEIMSSILNYLKKGCKGSMSLQNGLEKAKYLLTSIPPYGTKEIILYLGSMRSIDNSFLYNEWIESFCSNNITINAVLFIPELYIIKTITKTTGGICLCAMNNDHLLRLVLDNFIKPPPNNVTSTPLNINLVTMGFPDCIYNQTRPFCCSCHRAFTHSGYSCPKCKSIVCHIPTRCPICSIYLISPNHLAKSFAYLFQHPIIIPVSAKKIEQVSDTQINKKCELCDNSLLVHYHISEEIKKDNNIEYMCTNCSTHFCDECCRFILSTLHQCPNCCSLKI